MATTPEHNKNTVIRFFLAANNDQLHELDKFMHEEFTTYGPMSLLPKAVGREAHKQGIGGFKAAFPDATIEIIHLFAEGNKVMSHQKVTARHVSEFMGVAPTFKMLTWTASQLATFDENGIMIERHVIEDFLTMFQQLGLMPMKFG
ncbi:MAG: ester cyclase [Chloroflexota bacterium]|nr:ester cyclase [Chloroflexota bacterium]